MAVITFPDTEKIVADLTGAVLNLTTLPARQVVHHAYMVGSAVQARILRTDRVNVDTYGPTRDQARQAAEDVLATLTARFVHDEIDLVRVEVGPHPIPYVDDAVSLWQATYRIDVGPVG
ncbi:hypothetical protein MF406_14195 [Georgenia sp. TF02-10]|uniref:hypothetical protein n=1 Tax=Georgenia sp. TF02-10 TaxID=2917725 RepID=UPI001FA7B239|nr:hypothetical protein [Georgenia sp. TF02-10]UNX54083.1 hypothetical protein MF406_14195 [Georgenia sp. TF02-10]